MNIYQSLIISRSSAQGTTPPTPGASPYTYVVDPVAGNDADPGDPDNPFATIPAALAVAGPGDIIGLKTGVYRVGSMTFANSGTVGNEIILEAMTGETPVISGFNLVGDTGWAVYSGSIYRKAITLPVNGHNTSTTQTLYPTAIYANQILKADVMQVEARWPKIAAGTADLLNRDKYRQLSDPIFAPTTLTDNTIPYSSTTQNLTGATLVCNGWLMQEPRTISSHSGSTLTFPAIWDSTPHGKQVRRRYYLTGKLFMLQQATEWHYQVEAGQGYLYYWQTGGGSPTGLEYKARNWAFDLRGKANIKIRGITFKGCDAYVGDSNSTNITLDNVRGRYMNHHVRHDVVEWQGVGMSKQFGIKMFGANSKIINSEFYDSGSTGVWCGANTRVENCLFHDMGYVGYFANPVAMWTGDNQVVTRNTMYRTGRSNVDFGWGFGVSPGTTHTFNLEVSYNHFAQWGMISTDGGAWYVWGQRDLFGAQLHHNWARDCMAPDLNDNGAQCAWYFDQSTGPFTMHHNVSWNAGACDMYHETWNETRNTGTTTWTHPNAASFIYNNTFGTTQGANPRSYVTYRSAPYDRQRNNIYLRRIVSDFGSDVANSWEGQLRGSPYTVTNHNFLGTNLATDLGLYFRLAATSQARNIGIVIPGVTDDDDASPDAGAYRYNDPNPWVPGYVPVEYVGASPPVAPGFIYIDNVNTANVYTGSWLHISNASWNANHYQQTASVGIAPEATVVTSFTGSRVEWFSEELNNHAIVAVSIDGGAETMVDLYDARTDNNSTMVFGQDVTPGNHTIKLRLTNTRNGSSTGTPWPYNFVHDAFKIFT